MIDGAKSSLQRATARPVWNEGNTYSAAELLDNGADIEFFSQGLIIDSSLSQRRHLVFAEGDFSRGALSATNWGKVSEVRFILYAQ